MGNFICNSFARSNKILKHYPALCTFFEICIHISYWHYRLENVRKAFYFCASNDKKKVEHIFRNMQVRARGVIRAFSLKLSLVATELGWKMKIFLFCGNYLASVL